MKYRRIPKLGMLSAFLLSAHAAVAQQLPLQPESGTKTPASAAAEEVVIDFLGTILLFDRLFTEPTTVVSPDYLQRVSEPSSKFHSDYVQYRAGRIRRSELINRLPHVAMIGDSLSRNFYISSIPSMLWRARTEQRKNWFLDTDVSLQGIDSLYEKLNRITPLVVTEYSGDGAKVTLPTAREDFARRLARTHNLQGQAQNVARNPRFPDLVMVWIGHNNVDWVELVPPSERADPTKQLQELSQRFGANYTQSMRLLISRAKTVHHKVAFVVFGLADFKTFFDCRAKAQALHRNDPKQYPYFDVTCQRYQSFKPLYQKDTTRLSVMMDSQLKAMVNHLSRELRDYPNIRLQYSDLFPTAKIKLEMLHEKDAWHLSKFGKNIVAQGVFKALKPSLSFLGIGARSSTRSNLRE